MVFIFHWSQDVTSFYLLGKLGLYEHWWCYGELLSLIDNGDFHILML